MQSNWIPADTQPVESGRYICTVRRDVDPDTDMFGESGSDIKILRFVNGAWRMPRHIPEWINDHVTETVVAWMPMPEVYKCGHTSAPL